MLASLDVGYRGSRALAACVVFAHWRAAEPLEIVRAFVEPVADYRPGRFFERELPPLLAVVGRVSRPLETLVIDGYVWLGDGTEPGLGAHLHEAIGRTAAVIGVAKTRFRNESCSLPVLRGASRRPLHVTAAGLPPGDAAAKIASMHGTGRIPTLLGLADAACRL